MPLTVSETGNRMAESLMRDKTAIVLAQSTLSRFGVESVAALLQAWRSRLVAAQYRMKYRDNRLKGADNDVTVSYGVLRCYHRLTSQNICISVFERIADCPGYKQLQAAKIKQDDLNPSQRAFLRSMEKMRPYVCTAMAKGTNARPKHRAYILGRGEGIEAYTDGTTYIAIVDSVAEQMMKEGLPGFLRLAHLMVHEYLHDTEDTGSHAHDLEFMEAFHDIVLDSSDQLFAAATYGFNALVKENDKLSKKSAKQLDLIKRSEATAEAGPTA